MQKKLFQDLARATSSTSSEDSEEVDPTRCDVYLGNFVLKL